MKTLRTAKYWYIFAKKVWVPLGGGWFSVALGFTPYLSMDRAGALLICGVIVAEVFHDKRHRLYVHRILPGASTSHIYKEVDMVDGEKTYQGIEITPHQMRSGKSTVNADNWHLYQLAKKSEFRNFEGTRAWDLDRTMKRLESRVDWVIVISAVVGTILWAFAGQA